MSLMTVAQAKAYLRISQTADNDLVQILIDGVEAWASEKLAVRFIEDAAAAEITETVTGGRRGLVPRWHPITDVASVTNLDTDAAVASTLYRNDEREIFYSSGARWANGYKNFSVVYTAGYTSATLPTGLKMAVLSLVYRAYHKPGGSAGESTMGLAESWEELMTSDVKKQMMAFSFGSAIG